MRPMPSQRAADRPRPDLSRVLWLGGSACAGKTGVARRLARTYGLASYHCDEEFEAHKARAVAARHPHFCRLMDLAGDGLWRRPPAELAAELAAFYQDEFAMVVEDLAELTRAGPVLAEGAGLLPGLVQAHLGHPWQALFLVAGGEFRRRLYPGRGEWVDRLLARCRDPGQAFQNWMARDDRFAALVAAQAAERGLACWPVDGSRTLEDTAAAAARHFRLAS